MVLVAAFLCSAASSPWRKTGSQLIVMELETTTTTSLLTSENILLQNMNGRIVPRHLRSSTGGLPH